MSKKEKPVKAAPDGSVAKPRKKGGGALLWILLSIFAACGALFMPTALLVFIGMIPTLTAMITDADPRKPTAVCMGPLNLAGLIPALFDLWLGGNSLNQAVVIATSPFTWLMALGAATAGWLIYAIVPPVIASAASMKFEAELGSVEKELNEMVTVWGNDVKR